MATFPVKYDVPHNGYQFLQWAKAQNAFHSGWDLNKGQGNDDLGNIIKMPFAGEIIHVARQAGKYAFGLFVVAYHPSINAWSRFAHMDKEFVVVGDKRASGADIGRVGKSGTDYAHLHWEMWGTEMQKIQESKNYTFYPSGKTRLWVKNHYIDGIALVEQEQKRWGGTSEEAIDWAYPLGISNCKDLDKPMTRRENLLVMKRLFDLKK